MKNPSHITPTIADIPPGVGTGLCGDSYKPWGFDLWEHLHTEHGLTLMESELQEVVRLARGIEC